LLLPRCCLSHTASIAAVTALAAARGAQAGLADATGDDIRHACSAAPPAQGAHALRLPTSASNSQETHPAARTTTTR
jgi:hypothetical protein